MKNVILFVFLSTLLSVAVKAQYTNVVFNYEKSLFDDGQPLPSEEYLTINGQVPGEVDAVEMIILKPGFLQGSTPLYQNMWTRNFSDVGNRFVLPVNYKLKQNEEYDILVNYYKELSIEERQELETALKSHLATYLDQVTSVRRNKIHLKYGYRTILNNLTQIVRGELDNVKNQMNFRFDGFSDIVKEELKNVDGMSIKKSDRLIVYDTTGMEVRQGQEQIAYARAVIDNLKNQMFSEVDQYLATKMLILVERKHIPNYPTEKKKTTIAVNVGYGGVYQGGNNEKFASSPYAGFAVPFGRKATSPQFWSNASLNFGLFLQDLDFDDKDYTGPIFSRPSYIGLGYKIFHLLRLNAGGTFLQVEGSSGEGAFDFGDIKIRPYVGISAEFKLWIGVD